MAAPPFYARICIYACPLNLKQIPEGLVVDLVVELHLGALDEGSQFTR